MIMLYCNRCVTADKRHPNHDCHPIFCNLRGETETHSFRNLPDWQKPILRQYASDYYYRWHEEAWA